jgi:hypothetical protein
MGKTPLEFMLEVMENEDHPPELRFEAAEAAPSPAPRCGARARTSQLSVRESKQPPAAKAPLKARLVLAPTPVPGGPSIRRGMAPGRSSPRLVLTPVDMS